MKNLDSRLCILLLIVLISAGCGLYATSSKALDTYSPRFVSAGDGARLPEITIQASLTNSKTVLHQPISIELKVTNSYDRSISLELGQNYKERFELTVKSPDGSLKVFKRGVKNGLALIGTVSIEPRETYTQNLTLGDWFTPKTPGNYVINGKLVCPGKFSNGKKVTVDSDFNVEFTVGPEDSDVLKDVCEGLFSRIIDSNAVGERIDAAHTLSLISSPIATPYIKRALDSNRWVEAEIINTLRDRGGEESVEILIYALSRDYSDPEIHMQAKAALGWIDFYTTDPKLKRLIKTILTHD